MDHTLLFRQAFARLAAGVTVVTTTAPGSGHVYPLIPTMLELRWRGHEVTARAEESFVDILTGLGFPSAPIDPNIQLRAGSSSASSPSRCTG